MTSRQQLFRPTLKSQALALRFTLEVPTHRMVTLALMIGLITLATFNQPLLAQSEVVQTSANPTDTMAIKRAIRLLGDADPAVRRNARVTLENIGNAAISELEKAAKFETTDDYETQIIASQILTTLQDAIAVKDTEKFVRGESVLAGWSAFKNFAGDTQESRLLFRDIYLRNRKELLLATSPPTPGANRKYDNSYAQLKALIESSDLDQVCFGMFLLARKQSEQDTAESNADIQAIRIGPSLQQMKFLFDTLSAPNSPLTRLGSQSPAPTMLVRAIIQSAPQAPQLLSYKMSLIKRFKSKEICPLLLDFAAPEKPTVIRVQAISHAIKIADKGTLEKLNAYLDDTTEVGKYLVFAFKDAPASQHSKQLISEVQIRDLILLGNLRLTEKDHAQFGFNADAIDTTNNKLDIKLAGFVDNDTRQRAFERFRKQQSQQ